MIKLDELINDTIAELNPELDDDGLCEAMQEWEKYVEAIDYLVEKLLKLKAE